MKYLVDTHVLLWASVDSSQFNARSGLSKEARRIIEDEETGLYFSSAVIWEIAIKTALGKPDFDVSANVFRTALLDNGYLEMPINSAHAAAIAILEDHHSDPFDRIQIAQATVEGMELLTHDAKIAQYRKNPIKLV